MAETPVVEDNTDETDEVAVEDEDVPLDAGSGLEQGMNTMAVILWSLLAIALMALGFFVFLAKKRRKEEEAE